MKRVMNKMSDKDFAVNPVGQRNDSGSILAGGMPGSQISKKPSYLVLLEDTVGKTKLIKRFITLDKPDILQGFIQVKGFFTDEDEDTIINNLSDLLTSVKKELICEMMFPVHRIINIRSLVFNAIKNQTLVK